MAFRIGTRRTFSAAHFLRGYRGSCEALHGHNWTVEVELETNELDEIGLGWDFREIKARLDEVLSQLDHKVINDHPYFERRNPSAEELARFIHREFGARTPRALKLRVVRVYESQDTWASYSEE